MTTVTSHPFGQHNDHQITQYTISSNEGLSISVINYGAILTSCKLDNTEITRGFDTLEEYEGPHPCLGSVIGRFANRISHGKFKLGGVEHQLATNLSPHHLHGGTIGWHQRVWTANEDKDGVTFSLVSPDGEEGYPGTVKVEVSYRVEGKQMFMEYQAVSDAPTPLNITNHTYWNLNGVNRRDGTADSAMNMRLTVNSDKVLDVDDLLIPKGGFREMVIKDMRLSDVGDLDHCFVLRETDVEGGVGPLVHAATVSHDNVEMTVHTTEPGIQLYSSGNDRSALCLEAQHFPDSPNHPSFPSTILSPGEIYSQQTIHSFKWH